MRSSCSSLSAFLRRRASAFSMTRRPSTVSNSAMAASLVSSFVLAFRTSRRAVTAREVLRVVVHSGPVALSEGLHGLRVYLPFPGLEGGDAGYEPVVGLLGVVEVLPAEDEALPVMALEAEEAVRERVVALLLEQADGEELAGGLGHFPEFVVRW